MRKRQQQSLKPSTEKKLGLYTLAGAAGLSILNVTPASGAIVYTSVKEIGEGQKDHEVTVPIDLNHDGIIDFQILGGFTSVEGSQVYYKQASLYCEAMPGNQVAVVRPYPYAIPPSAKALSVGQGVGPKLGFSSLLHYGARLGVFHSVGAGPQSAAGQFYNKRNKFVALKLAVSGQTYYGWARISTQEVGNKLSFELVDYAYQSTPNVPILAGQGIPKSTAASSTPAALGLLAYGAEAIPAWRH